MNGQHEPCRWCGHAALLNGSGRCDDCDNHYRSHSIKEVNHMEKRNFHHGNYIAFGIILLISLSFASCYFDAGFSRTICFSNDVFVPSYSYLRTGMTPFKAQQQYEKFVGNQAGLLSNITAKKPAPIANPPALVPTNSTTVGGALNRTVSKPCTTQKENDWMAYCQSNLMGFDCWNANKDTKEMIMRNMAEIRGCVYAR
jgi:hypothetical protein